MFLNRASKKGDRDCDHPYRTGDPTENENGSNEKTNNRGLRKIICATAGDVGTVLA